MWISVDDELPKEGEWVLIPNYHKTEDFEPDVTLAQYRGCFKGCCDVEFRCVEASGCIPYIQHYEVRQWMRTPSIEGCCKTRELLQNSDS